MSLSLSQQIKNGQRLSIATGSAPVAAGDLVLIGGPGNEAWTAATADYAAIAPAGNLLPETQVAAHALPGSSRQPAARDRLGNVYVVGTDGSGHLVAFKYGPAGNLIASATLDASATSVNTAQLMQLSSGAYACVYARAAGALFFVIFDAGLSLLSGPASVVTEFHATNVVYHAACALSGGGFAIVCQTNAGTAVQVRTYSNAGAAVLTATTVQALAGSAAGAFLRVAQLSSGNLVVVMRGTMTAGGNAGVNIVTVNVTTGAVVVGPVNLDTTSTLGFAELSVLPGFFAVAAADGTNLVCGVYSNAAAAQGTPFSVGDTLNSIAYPQVKLCNDGALFWLAWFSGSTGLNVISASTAGVNGQAALVGGSVLNASTFALDADVVNGELVALAASNATAGQFWLVVGLPDASLGIAAPYLRSAPVAFGSAAATTGASWPRVLGGGGLYSGPSGPLSQPAAPPTNGDFTAIFLYDHGNSASTFIGIQKFEASAIVGFAVASMIGGQAGAALPVNPGPGEYATNAVGGTNGVAFDHLSAAPAGTQGSVYSSGAALGGIAQDSSSSSSSNTIITGATTLPGNGAMKSSILVFDFTPGSAKPWTAPSTGSYRLAAVGGGGAGATGGGGYSETVLQLAAGQSMPYTVGAAGSASSIGPVSATGGTGATTPGVGSGGTINTTGGKHNGASGHRFGNGQDGNATTSGGAGWSQPSTPTLGAGGSSAGSNGGDGGVDGFGLGLLPGSGGFGGGVNSNANGWNGTYGGGGGGGSGAGNLAGNGGMGGGGGSNDYTNASGGAGGLGGAGGKGGSGGVDGPGGAGVIIIEILG